MTNLFATNKTFAIAGMTNDTHEPYVSIIGYELKLFKGVIGSYRQAVMVTRSTQYVDNAVEIASTHNNGDRRATKEAALAEATARADEINAAYREATA